MQLIKSRNRNLEQGLQHLELRRCYLFLKFIWYVQCSLLQFVYDITSREQ